jgi:hypothetical protein
VAALTVGFDGLSPHAWSDFCRRHGVYPLFAGPEWKDVLAASHGVEVRCLVASSNGEIRGLLPLYQVRSWRGRITLLSLPRGLVAADAEAAEGLLVAATDYARSLGAMRAAVSSAVHYAAPCKSTERQTLVLVPGGNIETCWTAMRDKTRNAIRKAEKSGLELHRGWSQLKDFYAVYAERMAAKNVPFQPYAYFRTMAAAFGERGDVFLATRHGEPLGGMLLLWQGQTAVYFAGGVTRAGEAFCTSQFLLWQMVQHAMAVGITAMDLGESATGSGVYRFKTMFGAVPVPVWHYDLLQPAATGPAVSSQAGPVSLAARVEAAVLAAAPDWLRRRLLLSIRHRSALV